MKTKKTSSNQLHFQWITVLISTLSDLDGLFADRGLPNTTQASVLLFLDQSSPSTRIGTLSKELSLRPNTTTASVNNLENAGMLTRSKTDSDGRGTVLSLTQEGKKAVSEIHSIFKDYFNERQGTVDTLLNKAEDSAKFDSLPDYETYCLVFQESRKLLLELTYYIKPYSINLSALRVLAHIGLHRSRQRMIDISDDLNMHQNVLSISAKQLLKREYISRTSDSSDKRAVIIKATSRGKKVINSTVDYLGVLETKSSLCLNNQIPN